MKRILITTIILVFLLVGDLPAQRRGGGGGRGGGGFSGTPGAAADIPAVPGPAAEIMAPRVDESCGAGAILFASNAESRRDEFAGHVASDPIRKPGESIRGRDGKSLRRQARAAVGTRRLAITQLVSTT